MANTLTIDEQLNKTGFLLQQRLYQALRDEKFKSTQTKAELEVSFEHPIGEIGGIDIRLLMANTSVTSAHRAVYVIECKRYWGNTSDWVFMSREKERNQDESAAIITQSASSLEGYTNKDNLWFQALGMLQTSELPFTYQGVELHTASNNIPKDERMWKSLTQAARGTIFSAGDEKLFQVLADGRDQKRKHYYVPIVATTAALWMTKHKYAEVDMDTGTLAEADIARESVDWVAYQYPVASVLAGKPKVDSLTIFIVRAPFLVEFIKKTWLHFSNYP